MRRREQIDGLRRAFMCDVIHIHLTASPSALRKRYATREAEENKKAEELGIDPDPIPSFDQARANATEKRIETLATEANLVARTTVLPEWLTFARAYVRVLGWKAGQNVKALGPPTLVGVAVVAAVLAIMLGIPVLLVAYLSRSAGLVLLYGLVVLVFAMIIGVALSASSPISLGRRTHDAD